MAERGIFFKDDFVTEPDKSWFDMSFDFLLSGNFGELIPTTCMECMPEDKIHAKSDSFVRLAPLVSPTFGKVNMFDYHFYVRNRSIWTQWESFIADKDQRKSWQQANPLWTPPEMPYIDVREVLFNSKLYFDGSDIDFTMHYVGAHDSIYHVSISGYSGSVWYLVLIYNESDNVPVFSSYITNNVSFIDTNTGTHNLIIPYIPNKDEHLNDKLYSPYYNPFSNGTIFDYLGVDLSGLYKSNIGYFNSACDAQGLTIANPDAMLTVPYELDIHISENVMYNMIPISLNVGDFLRRHAILGLGYCHVADSGKFGTVLRPDGTVYTSTTVSGDEPGTEVTTHTSTSTQIKLMFDSETAKISSLPIRAYHSIYIDYFRDQNYISVNPCIDFSRDGNDVDWTQDSDNIFDYLTLNYKAYEHDPYTSALPQAQRGEPVRYLPDSRVGVKTVAGASDLSGQGRILYAPASTSNPPSFDIGIAGSGSSPASSLHAELTVDLSAATIENLRFANALQKLKEREARSGGRYFELMEAIFGARIDDAKIDRPIFLGGDKTPIQVSEVLQTSATEVTSDQPLGQMAGRAVAIGNDDFIEYVTPDHGFFIEICAVLPRTNYQQGLLPMFTRKVRLDYPMPQFAQLGETQVPQSELWYSADESEDKKPFGYQSRYYDSKYQRDRTSGTFKDALAHWTWSRIFDNAPLAGKAFIEVHPDYRQFAVTDKTQEHLYIHMWHDIQVLRSLPVFGTPKL